MEIRRFPKVSQVSPDSRPAVLLHRALEVVPVEAVELGFLPKVARHDVDKRQAFGRGLFWTFAAFALFRRLLVGHITVSYTHLDVYKRQVHERLVYKSTIGDYYLVADAYDGRAMKECLQDFLKALSGNHKKTIIAGNPQVGIFDHARLLALVGHNGLMDLTLPETFIQADSLKREGIVLACYSKSYFSSRFKDAGAYPLLWTSNLFGPEAYSPVSYTHLDVYKRQG